ncbi:hypothetical protein TNIN_152811 [Trichonephila inaurata madagascariensis]|uniref:Uncharacterized protein n=1 Tax=Trichonephila inaurata madagascariensis TaxID=2747483 RepID=A0A8X6X0X3_9ARAC|nr:hypothetical protein TNIN_152811 [Trichonephila inaurata madagascariensis]
MGCLLRQRCRITRTTDPDGKYRIVVSILNQSIPRAIAETTISAMAPEILLPWFATMLRKCTYVRNYSMVMMDLNEPHENIAHTIILPSPLFIRSTARVSVTVVLLQVFC